MIVAFNGLRRKDKENLRNERRKKGKLTCSTTKIYENEELSEGSFARTGG
jgi:hypothetical protein